MRAEPTPMKVSVIVPCRNERDAIRPCLDSILRQDLGQLEMEVIVADGRSDDGTRERLAEWARKEPRLRVVDNPQGIVSTGLNRAIAEAKGEVIIRMDAHTAYAPTYIRECVAALEGSGADCVGGPWLAEGKGYVSRAVAAAFQCPLVVGGARGHRPEYEGEVDTVYLGCWRRAAFSRYGWFDEELVRNQDDELSLRIRQGGGRIHQSPRIQSRYTPRDSLGRLFRQYAQYGYWKVRVMRKHGRPASWRHLAPGALVAGMVVLGALAWVWPPLFRGWVLLVAAYVGLNLAASLACAWRAGWTLLPVLPAVVGCYHLGYGYGFLHGCWDLMRNRSGALARGFTHLTR